MNIVIEKGVPVPVRRSKNAEFIAAVKPMEIGDSFIYPASDKNLSSLLTVARKRIAYGFTTMRTPNGVRVWRVK